MGYVDFEGVILVELILVKFPSKVQIPIFLGLGYFMYENTVEFA